MHVLPDIVSRTLSLASTPELRRIVVGVSGGADSTALALVLAERRPGVSLVLARIDHALPEAEPPEDRLAVRALAERLHAVFREERVDVRATMAQSGESLEMAARRLRRAALQRIARQEGADAIALGHNADDQVETLLLRLARGTGPRGLGGMAVWQPGKAGEAGLLRPLLDCSRDGIRAWLRERGVAWREDPTNAEDDVLRNRIRHHVLPALYGALGESAREGFLRTAALLRDEEAGWLAPLAEAAWRQCLVAGDGDALDAAKLASLSPALRRRVVLLAAQRAGVPAAFQTGEMLERLAAFATRESRGSLSLDLGGGFTARRVYGAVLLSSGRPRSKEPGVLRVEAATGFERTARGDFGDRPLVAYLSRAKVGEAARLSVRPVREGDRLRAMGAEGSTKISDILVDRKIPREERGSVVVVCAGERVAWLPGHSVDAFFAVEGPDAPSWKCILG